MSSFVKVMFSFSLFVSCVCAQHSSEDYLCENLISTENIISVASVQAEMSNLFTDMHIDFDGNYAGLNFDCKVNLTTLLWKKKCEAAGCHEYELNDKTTLEEVVRFCDGVLDQITNRDELQLIKLMIKSQCEEKYQEDDPQYTLVPPVNEADMEVLSDAMWMLECKNSSSELYARLKLSNGFNSPQLLGEW